MSRVTERKDFDVPTRLYMLEKDEDDKDADMTKLQTMVASFSRSMMLILTAIATGSVLAAVDIILNTAKR